MLGFSFSLRFVRISLSPGSDQTLRRSISYTEPGWRLAYSFISEATAEASHWFEISRSLVLTPPSEIDVWEMHGAPRADR